ncbi:MAG: sugar phosphate isomerase/epimerase [Deltaproteobacteria bacterium]|nr:sugar phosphate isomerase/epimerase [Deltaproteobacteria bacterium]TLN01481.1 MAG: sugar phosphate isomerase/epimerase [bacterium]
MKAKQVFVHAPYALIGEHLDFILQRGINPEIAFTGDSLDTLDVRKLREISQVLIENGIRTTIHAPFMDLSPGALDRLVLEATRQRFQQVMAAAAILKPAVVVFHPGYDRWRFGSSRNRWLAQSIETFQPVVESAATIGCTVAVENIFEEEPSTLKALLEAFDSPLFRHCFDVGHWNLFSKLSMAEWFAELGPYIAEAHIHDNHGFSDDHSPLGEAGIDFPLFFRLMAHYAPAAAWTIEAHNRQAVERALENLAPFLAEHYPE